MSYRIKVFRNRTELLLSLFIQNCLRQSLTVIASKTHELFLDPSRSELNCHAYESRETWMTTLSDESNENENKALRSSAVTYLRCRKQAWQVRT